MYQLVAFSPALILTVSLALPASAQPARLIAPELDSYSNSLTAPAISGECDSLVGTLRPSVFTTTLDPEDRRLNIPVQCVDLVTGAPLADCTVTVSLERFSYAGGHGHDDPGRPIGTLNPTVDVTGASGTIVTQYTAPEPGGPVIFRAEAEHNGSALPSLCRTILVRVPDLREFLPGPAYELVGSTAQHPQNHFGTPALLGFLVDLAEYYQVITAGTKKLPYNDISLPNGGVFDITGTWTPQHYWHRRGKDVDVRTWNMTDQEKLMLRQFTITRGHIFIDHTPPIPPHLHLRRQP